MKKHEDTLERVEAAIDKLVKLCALDPVYQPILDRLRRERVALQMELGLVT